ncbi:MAG: hypothetical protein Q8K59_01115 [Nitrosomonas sp.]|nr:hypothetical protein [Nitrosomonas sp.]MDP1949701.1 hypothetical protein [Nitrosomonas sp.]
MKFTAIFFLLNLAFVPTVTAEEIQNLQQRASISYEQMTQAQREANVLAKVAADAEQHQQRIEQRLIRAQQEATEARKKSAAANLILKQATLRWQQSSDALSNAWENLKDR